MVWFGQILLYLFFYHPIYMILALHGVMTSQASDLLILMNLVSDRIVLIAPEYFSLS